MSTRVTGAKVFVVGAGPSGLAAAWRLRGAGCDVTILEGRDRVGGQLLTIERDGFLIEAATTILPAAYESVMGLVREAGLTADLVPASSLIAFVRDGQHHTLRADHLAVDAVRSKLLGAWSKAKVGRFALDMARVRRVLSYEDLSVAGAFDSETPEAYAVRRGLDGELYDYFIEPIVRAGAGVPANVISVVEFFFLAQKVLGTQLFAFKRGYSSFARRLADGFDVITGATVREVVQRGDEVEVTWDGPAGATTQTGAGAIVSSMGNRVPGILPQLAPSRAEFLRALNYTSCITFSLGLSRPPAGEAAFIVAPRPVSNKVFAAIAEHHKAPGRVPPGKGLVTMYGMNGWSERNMESTDEEILADALPDSEKLVPGLSDLIEFSMVHRWYPVLVYSHPGLYRALGRFHASRPLDSRVHLAGSYNSSSNVNTATVAGERAARELLVAIAGAAQ
jgi:protoporphyrinogen/coproporphyrinogen III oxidase